jgi:hypothetical protein
VKRDASLYKYKVCAGMSGRVVILMNINCGAGAGQVQLD